MVKMLTKEEKSNLIEAAVELLKNGKIVEVADASYSASSVAIGDFVSLGMAEKIVWRDGMNWRWKGPGTISMSGRVYSPGEMTEEIYVDWT